MKYITSPFILINFVDATPMIFEPLSNKSYKLTDEVQAIIFFASQWRSRQQICALLNKTNSDELSDAVFESLIDRRILFSNHDNMLIKCFKKTYWDPISFAFHLRIGGENTQRLSKKTPPTPYFNYRVDSNLPAPIMTNGTLKILKSRRSIRDYSDQRLNLQNLSSFLDATLSIGALLKTDLGVVSLRPTPSGGARHPIEAIIIANRVDGLSPGVYRYNPLKHGLCVKSVAPNARKSLNTSFFGTFRHEGRSTKIPQVLILLTAVPERTLWKYDSIGYHLILEDVGCLFQSMYIAATALGLAACAIGGGPQGLIHNLLNLDGFRESFVGAFSLGLASTRQSLEFPPHRVRWIRKVPSE